MQKLVVLSGAGISAESGLRTFRDSDGLWENYRLEEVATPEAWRRDPELVQRFYNMRRADVLAAQPNAAHRFLAELENRYEVHIITQNIDDLHERAGSSKVLHLHGHILFSKSSGPRAEAAYYPIEGADLNLEELCPDGYPLRPHVVWFGEAVPMLEPAADICSTADYFLVVGTSLQVYPAAGLVHAVPKNAQKIVLDPSASQLGLDNSYNMIKSGAVDGVEQLKHILLG